MFADASFQQLAAPPNIASVTSNRRPFPIFLYIINYCLLSLKLLSLIITYKPN